MPVLRSDLEKMALGNIQGQPLCIGSQMAEELIHMQDDCVKLVNAFNRALFKIVELKENPWEMIRAMIFGEVFKAPLNLMEIHMNIN
jgi:hypothetical protein